MRRIYHLILCLFFLPSSLVWAQLVDCYDASNWTATTTNTNGSVENDGSSIVINSDFDESGTGLDVIDCAATDGTVTYCITIPSSGEITFDWAAPGGPLFNPLVEKFGYCLNGIATELTSVDPPPFGTSSGTATATVAAGDEFCFIAASKWAQLGPDTYTINNFTVPACPPPPPLSDCYDASNWMVFTENTNGSVMIDDASILINSDTDFGGTNLDSINCAATDGNVSACIIIPTSGEITFDWSTSVGPFFNPLVERFGYCLNGAITELTSINPPPFGTSSGTATITVEAGDELCFVSASKFADGFSPTTFTVNNFILPACPLPPLSECYDASNWTAATNNTNGSVVADETVIILSGDTDGMGTNLDVLDCSATDGNVSYCITVPASGDITFDWAGPSGFSFNPLVEKFGYCLNGVATELTSLNPPPFGTSSGTTTVTVAAGDELCFIAASKFADGFNAGPYTINNLILPACPDSLSIIVSAITDTLACFGDTNGAIVVTPSGGAPEYTYNWDSQLASGDNPTNLPAGVYCVTVTDLFGGTASTCIEILEPTELQATVTVDAGVSCNGENDGQATVNSSGGTMGYSYLWDNMEITATAIALSGGMHSLTISDANACELIVTVDVPEPEALSVSMSSTPDMNMSGDGTATASPVGGTLEYTYEWNTNPVQTTATAINLNAGTYQVVVTDANGCEIIGSVVVDQLTGLTDFAEISFINISPNPSAGLVCLDVDFNRNMDVSIQLVNPIGQVVATTQVQQVPSIHQSFDWSELPKGIYNLVLTSESRQVIKRVILY